MTAETDKSAATELDEALDFEPRCDQEMTDDSICGAQAHWFLSAVCPDCDESFQHLLCDRDKDYRVQGGETYCPTTGVCQRTRIVRLERLS